MEIYVELLKYNSSIEKSILHSTGSIPVDSNIMLKGGLNIMEILINGVIGAAIANLMKDIKNKKISYS